MGRKQRQIDELKAEIEQLKERVQELESKGWWFLPFPLPYSIQPIIDWGLPNTTNWTLQPTKSTPAGQSPSDSTYKWGVDYGVNDDNPVREWLEAYEKGLAEGSSE